MTLFTILMTFLLTLSAAVYATPIRRDGDKGVIVTPVSGAAIAPGSSFDFQYNTMADYCASSYNFTVWLLTTPPSVMAPSDVFMTGHYFGRFSEENYPANPYPVNPAPSQLVMPDLSKSPGGFGAGSTASNVTFHIAVLEEWDSCSGSLGNTIGLAMTPIIYNATDSS